jgi:hypothetical protein
MIALKKSIAQLSLQDFESGDASTASSLPFREGLWPARSSEDPNESAEAGHGRRPGVDYVKDDVVDHPPLDTRITEGKSRSTYRSSLRREWRKRELMATLVKHNGLGLFILAHLREAMPMRASELVALVERDADTTVPVLTRLVQFGAAALTATGRYAITRRGRRLIANLERNADIDLRP